MAIDHAATKEALERIREDGSDLERPLSMDFFVAVPDERSGLAVAARVEAMGFEASVEEDPETRTWTCYCTMTLVPTLEAVLEIEARLQAVGEQVGGYADGFGTYGNADDGD